MYSAARNAWRLRYAPAEVEDPYGGSVTLLGIDASAGLRQGQQARVEGRLKDPSSSEPSPPYQVSQFRPLP